MRQHQKRQIENGCEEVIEFQVKKEEDGDEEKYDYCSPPPPNLITLPKKSALAPAPKRAKKNHQHHHTVCSPSSTDSTLLILNSDDVIAESKKKNDENDGNDPMNDDEDLKAFAENVDSLWETVMTQFISERTNFEKLYSKTELDMFPKLERQCSHGVGAKLPFPDVNTGTYCEGCLLYMQLVIAYTGQLERMNNPSLTAEDGNENEKKKQSSTTTTANHDDDDNDNEDDVDVDDQE